MIVKSKYYINHYTKISEYVQILLLASTFGLNKIKITINKTNFFLIRSNFRVFI
jgi:hypothetical protein